MLRRARTPLVALLALVLLIATPGAASALVYWGNGTSFGGPSGTFGQELGRASLDGSNADRYWWDVETTVEDLEVRSGVFYWPEDNFGNGRIVRGNPANRTTDRSFINGLGDFCDFACDIAVSATHVYWTERGDTNRGWIGRANLDGTGVDRTWLLVDTDEVYSVNAIAVDGQYLYAVDGWDDIERFDAATGANRVVLVPDVEMDLTSLVADSTYLYYGGIGPSQEEGLIGRVPRTGGSSNDRWLAPENGGIGDDYFFPWRIAVNGTHLYWSSQYRADIDNGSIGRVRLADRFVEPNLIVLTSSIYDPAGLALDATVTAPRVVVPPTPTTPKAQDRTKPTVTVKKPKKKAATKAKKWKRVRGKVADAGSGPRDVRVKAVNRTRTGTWRFFNGKKWKVVKSKKKAFKRAKVVVDRTVASGSWSIKLKKPAKGRVLVRYWAFDEAGNRSTNRTVKQRIVRR